MLQGVTEWLKSPKLNAILLIYRAFSSYQMFLPGR